VVTIARRAPFEPVAAETLLTPRMAVETDHPIVPYRLADPRYRRRVVSSPVHCPDSERVRLWSQPELRNYEEGIRNPNR